jgi:hypothetical protein
LSLPGIIFGPKQKAVGQHMIFVQMMNRYMFREKLFEFQDIKSFQVVKSCSSESIFSFKSPQQ